MKHIFVYAVLLVFFCSCEKRVAIKLPYEGDKIVVNSLIQPDSVIYISVTRSMPSNVYNENDFADISNATVRLEENGVDLTPLKWQQIKGHGYFVSTQKAVLGKRYTVSVAAAGMAPVTAADTLPPAPDASMAAAQRNSSRVRFTLKDNPATTDYYRIRIFAYGPDGRPDTMRLFRLDPSFNNNMVDVFSSSITNSLIMNDTRFNGKEVTFVLQTQDPIVNACRLMVEVSTLTNSAYQYFRTVASQAENGGVLITEPIRVFTNVSGGYGIVAGINTKSITFKVE